MSDLSIEPWRDHPLALAGAVELVPMEWLWKYWGRDVSPKTDLLDGSLVDLDGLWADLSEKGMHDPLILRVGLVNKKFRLEAGNHRIQVLHAHGVAMVPVAVQICDLCGPDAPDVMTDAQHNFDIGDDLLQFDRTSEYLAPSAVFKSLAGIAQAI